MERNPVNSTSHTAFSETNVTLLLLRAQCLLEVNQATRANGMPVCDKSSGKRQAAADANLSPLTAAHQRCKNRLRVLEQFQSFIEDQQKTLRSLKQALEITRQAKTALRRDVEREGLAPEQGGACWTLMSSPGADASPEGSGPVESAEDPQTPPHYQILVPPVAEVGSVTPFKLETNESASGGTEVGNAVSAVPVGENEEEVEEEEVTPKQQEWHLYRTWQPSEVMLLANVEQPHGDENNPVRHILCLSTIVHKKPLGIWAKDAALRKQGRYCKQCLTPLRKRYLPFPSWKEARFCYYTGMYYCTSCHSGRHAVIPARVLHLWDFNPRPVCNSALDFLELQRTRPVYCVSAIKPELYVHSLLLQTARLLRLQLAALREMGMACPVFRQLFYRSDIAAEAERAGGRQVLSNTSKGSRPRPLTPSNTVVAVALEAIPSASEYYVPRSRRYLIEESEIWSMTDFDDMRRGQLFSLYEGNSVFKPLFSNNSAAMASQLAAYSKGTGAFFGKCNVVTYLKEVRARMTQHIFMHGCKTCAQNSVSVCRWCCPADLVEELDQVKRRKRSKKGYQNYGSLTSSLTSLEPGCDEQGMESLNNKLYPYTVYPFDIIHVRRCKKCASCYHKSCFQELQRHMRGKSGCLQCTESAR